jgi:hypothetical protein
MNVVPCMDVPPGEWDALCDASRQAWLFHRRAWIEIESRYFMRLNLSFALAHGGRLVALMPLYLSDVSTGTTGERLLHSGIHRHTGLALAPDLPRELVSAARTAAMHRVLQIASEVDVDRVQLNTHNLTPENRDPCTREEIPFWVEDYGFQLGLGFGRQGMIAAPGMAVCNSDQIVDLHSTVEMLFQNLEESCRRAVRKAQSFDLASTPATDESALAAYFGVARASVERTGEALPDRRYYEDIWSAYAREGRCAILLARQGAAVVGGVFLVIDKSAASLLGAVSDPRALPMRVNDFMQWSTLLWAKEAGLRFYRLGPWFPSVDPEFAIAKVSRFKKKFGGRSLTVIQGSWYRKPERYREPGRLLVDELCGTRCETTSA